MDLLWQWIIIGIAIAGALGYLVFHFVRKRRNKTGCADCTLMQALRRSKEAPRR